MCWTASVRKGYCRAKTTKRLDSIGRTKVLFSSTIEILFSYFIYPDAIGDVSEEKITELKEKLATAEEENKVLGHECNKKQKETSALSETPTNSSLSLKLKEAQAEKKTLSQNLKEAKSSCSTTSKKDIEKIDKALEKQVSIWRKRKSIAMEVINSVSEGSGKSPVKVMEEMGVESDEDYNVSLQKITAFLRPPTKRARFG